MPAPQISDFVLRSLLCPNNHAKFGQSFTSAIFMAVVIFPLTTKVAAFPTIGGFPITIQKRHF